MCKNKQKITVHCINCVEHGAIESFVITLLVGSKYPFMSYDGQYFSS